MGPEFQVEPVDAANEVTRRFVLLTIPRTPESRSASTAMWPTVQKRPRARKPFEKFPAPVAAPDHFAPVGK